MAHVVTEPCFGCKYTDCITLCPVECFHEGEQMLFIDPDIASTAGPAWPSAPWKRSTMRTMSRRNGRSTFRSMPRW